MKKLLSLFLIISLSLTAFEATSQNLLQDSLVFKDAEQKYQEWINTNGWDEHIRVENIEIRDSTVLLLLMAPSGDDWFSFSQDYMNERNINLREVLFSKMLHLFQVEEHQAGLKMLSDSNDHQLRIQLNRLADTIQIEELVPKSVQDEIKIFERRLSGFNIIGGKNSVAYTTTRIKAFLNLSFDQQHFKNRNLIDKYKYKSYNNKAYYQVWNIQNVVLTDVPTTYFEVLDFRFKVKKIKDRIVVKYTLFGKYSRSYYDYRFFDYTDISTSDYSDDFDIWVDDFVDELRKFLRE